MYTLEKAKCKNDRRSGRWLVVDLTNERITTLLTRYGDVYLYVAYPGAGAGHLKGLYLRNVQHMLSIVGPDVTVSQWLTSIGNVTLPLESDLLEDNVRLVKYAQAWHVGYKATPVGRFNHIDSNLNDSHKEDLLLDHPKLDLEDFTSKALVTVNGFFHMCDGSEEGIRVLDANTNIRNSNDNQIGIYSFETVGAIKQVPIKTDMITKLKVEAPLYDGAYLTMPVDIDLTDKTVLLVVGGYLNVLNDVYYKVSERTWRVNFSRMLFMDRFFQSYKELNLQKLGLLNDSESPSLLNINDLKNDATIENYLTSSQSFFVIVDSPSFFHTYESIESLNLPGRSVDVKYDRIPLVGAYGRMMDYHVIKEPGKDGTYPPKQQLHVYCASLNKRNHYDNNTRNWPDGITANAGRYPVKPFTHDNYSYRLMGVEY